MASALSHAVVAVGFSEGLHRDEGRWRICFWGIVCSVVPDLDVVGFRFGVRYGDLWGHRGLTHSLAFAALFGSVVAFLVFRGRRWDAIRPRLLFYFCTVAASHGML
ncbi:MAG TPA: metal-dependent hydrolase, partial [Nitrospiria bacterium]|nr:metal-dependent hydrolase [Nitrospiria bacterium]